VVVRRLHGEWAITQTNEFKVAVSGAGMANLISEFGMEELDGQVGNICAYSTPSVTRSLASGQTAPTAD